MRAFKQRRSYRAELTRLYLKGAGVVLLLVVTLGMMHAAWGMYTKSAEASKGQEEVEAQLKGLQAQQSGITASLGELATERGVEAQVRERYGVVKPGEGEIVIVRDAATHTGEDEASWPWWKRIFKTLFVW